MNFSISCPENIQKLMVSAADLLQFHHGDAVIPFAVLSGTEGSDSGVRLELLPQGIAQCPVSKYPSAIVVNASRHPSIIIKGADGKKYKVIDCMGNILEEGTVCGTLCEINVPLSGMICID